MSRTGPRRYAVGAEPTPAGTHFRVWAPLRRRVAVALQSGERNVVELVAEAGGYFSALVPEAGPGASYGFLLDDDTHPFPDPASRFQPEGPHGPSQVVDPSAFRWTDHEWKGVRHLGQVISEIHIGTFTPEGTWAAAATRLADLAEVGITTVEIMPVADFPGRFGWGYDGVDLWAPTRLYGTPDDFRAFVDAAHSNGLAVLLDVVYNHFGPDGNYLEQFTPDYFTDVYENEWGKAINFDGEEAGPVREFFCENARLWIDEYHLDGLRLDATQEMFDRSPVHILSEIVDAVRSGAGSRATFVVAENEPQESRLVRPREEGGYGLDALWNDDFHHAAAVALTGRREAYYTDYRGTPQEFISAAKWGFLFQGQRYKWQGKRRGSASLDLAAHKLVSYLQNHDQIANSGRGEPLSREASPAAYRAMTALLLLMPQTPMLFQGQEFGASAPFLYFADHNAELAPAVESGRKDFLGQFITFASPEGQAMLPSPAAPTTYERCRIDWAERARNRGTLALYRDLLRLRRISPFREQDSSRLYGAVLTGTAFVLRFLHGGEADALLVVNLGPSRRFDPSPEPLLAPPEAMRWETAWSSEAPEYGGSGTARLDDDEANWWLPGPAAVVLRPAKR